MENNEYYVGKDVMIRDDSRYRDQAYYNGGNGIGKIIRYVGSFGLDDYCLKIDWNNGHTNDYRLQDVIMLDETKRRKIKNPDDIYGEDDWGWEEIQENTAPLFKLIKNCSLLYKNKDEMINIASELKKHGIKTYTDIYDMTFQYKYYYYDEDEKSFVRSISNNRSYLKELDYSEFMELVGKKFKKIERPEIDPYGEEDWGYENIEENKNENFNDELILESFDQFVGFATKELMNFIKLSKIKYDKNNNKQIQKLIKQYTYPLKLTLKITIARGNDIEDMEFAGESKEYYNGRSSLKINIFMNPNDEPEIYNELTGRIKGIIHHELEHKTQEGINRIKDRPRLTDDEQLLYYKALINNNFFEYFTNKLEIPAYAKQMYSVAKFYKRTIDDIIDNYLTGAIESGRINEQEKEKIKKIWIDEIKRKYPKAKFEKITTKYKDFINEQ